jgi:hypothetical protein
MPRNWGEILDFVDARCPSVHFFTATAAYAYIAYTNSTTGFTDIGKLMSELKRYRRRIGANRFRTWADRMANEKDGISIRRRTVFEKQLAKYYRILLVQQGGDVYARYLKIHVLQPL